MMNYTTNLPYSKLMAQVQANINNLKPNKLKQAKELLALMKAESNGELASKFSEARIHANLCELKREPLLADGTKDNRLKIWENYYHVVFFTVHKKEP